MTAVTLPRGLYAVLDDGARPDLTLAEQARVQSREGSHRAAFSTLVRALHTGLFNQALWRVAAGCAARAAGWKRKRAAWSVR